MSGANRLFELNHLVLKIIEGQASPEDTEKLSKLLLENPQAVRDYRQIIDIYVDVTQYGSIQWNSLADLGQMADYERLAPALEVQKSEPTNGIIQNVVFQKTKRQINKFSLAAAVFLMAASLAIVALVQLIPQREIREVATLSSGVNAVFSGHESSTCGTRLFNREEPYYLKEGVIQITFDNGADAIIEAPCEFSLKSAGEMAIQSGRMYAKVSKEAQGFAVDTLTATIIDLGTEFAVKINYDGSSEVHVIKGKTELLTATHSAEPKREILDAGQARRVDFTGKVSSIPLQQEVFVKQVDSESLLDMNFQGLASNAMPAGWVLVDNNGDKAGPDFTCEAGGPSGAADICGRVGPADGSLEQGPHETPGGWIQCLKPFDSAAGFDGGFDFRLGNTENGPDAQFLFGHISQGATNYHYVAISSIVRSQQFFTVTDGIRKAGGKYAGISNLTPEVWYHCRFRVVPVQGTMGRFSYEITDLDGKETYIALDPVQIILPETLTFGFGNYNDTACFDNIKITRLSNSGD